MPPLTPGDPGDGGGDDHDPIPDDLVPDDPIPDDLVPDDLVPDDLVQDDDFDDAGYRVPLPPEDRLWRHPSEVAASAGTAAAPTRRFRTAVLVVGSGAAGALLTVAGMASVGAFDDRVVKRIGAPAVSTSSSLASVVDRVGPSVAALAVQRMDGEAVASAVVVRRDGYLVTDAGAVRGAVGVEVLLHAGDRVTAEVVGVDELTGVAVLHVDGDGLSPAPVGHSDRVALGAPVTLVGARDGRGWEAAVQTAEVSALAPRIEGADGRARYGMIVVDEPFGPAAAGGALIGGDGTVAGIATADMAQGQTGMATPIELVVHIAEQLIRHGRARHVWLGLHGTDGRGTGAVVEDVVAGGPAALAGLSPGDVVVGVDGEATPSMAELIVLLRLHLPGDLVTLRVQRDGETREVGVHLASREG